MNTMSQSLELKELNEIRYRNTLVFVGHRNPLIFALVCDSERTTVDLRIKILQLTESFPRYTIGETRVDVGQMDFSESDEFRSLVENIFLK
jgi:predicted methyltransferase MtxX (methanogen marker protein 4)